MITEINHITFATSDILKSLDFYRNFLKFNLAVKWEKGVYLTKKSIWLCLIYDKETKQKALKEYTHIAFSVDSVTFKKLSDEVVKRKIPIWKDNKSEGESLYLLDPDLNKIEIHCGNLFTRIAHIIKYPYENMTIYLDNNAIVQSERIKISIPLISDLSVFLDKVNISKSLHQQWVHPPKTQKEYLEYIQRINKDNQCGYLLRLRATDEIIGIININEIIKGYFQSAYLGFYLFSPYGGQGFMKEGLQLVIQYAFSQLGLHRLEANIQPDNKRSIKLIKSLGFRHEGFSPKYLLINNRWADHERFALTKE